MGSKRPSSSLQRFVSGVAEFVFEAKLGVADPPLVDYVSDLICRFVRWDVLFKIRDREGRRLDEVAGMVAEADQRTGDARRAAHRHIGDFTLFWAGVYPDALPKLRGPARKDYFVDYCAQGKRAYYLASTIEADRDAEPPADVLERLSVQFELCAFGLTQVRLQWEKDAEAEGLPHPILIH
jgi:hypothetical protein